MALTLEHVVVYGISIGIVLTLVAITGKIIRSGKEEEGGVAGTFLSMIRDRYGYPSLSLFQFFLWTVVISFGFLSIYLIRISEGVYEPPIEEIPFSILILMGISTAVPIGKARMLTGLEEGKGRKTKNVSTEEDERGKKFSSILQDKKGKATLPKFQMFIWTWIAIIIYLTIMFSSVSDLDEREEADFEQKECQENKYICLTFPDIDPSLVVLMGLSQTAYLGHEYYMRHQQARTKEKKKE